MGCLWYLKCAGGLRENLILWEIDTSKAHRVKKRTQPMKVIGYSGAALCGDFLYSELSKRGLRHAGLKSVSRT